MVVEVGRGCELFPAGGTRVRFFPTVNPLVCVEAGWGWKSLGANCADVRPLSSVSAQMTAQQGWPVESLLIRTKLHHLHLLLFDLLKKSFPFQKNDTKTMIFFNSCEKQSHGKSGLLLNSNFEFPIIKCRLKKSVHYNCSSPPIIFHIYFFYLHHRAEQTI